MFPGGGLRAPLLEGGGGCALEDEGSKPGPGPSLAAGVGPAPPPPPDGGPEDSVHNLGAARALALGPVAYEVHPAEPEDDAEEPGAYPWKGEAGGFAHQALALEFRPGTVRATTLSLLVNIMGTGCLSVAHAVRGCGAALGAALVLACAGLTLFSCHQLAAAGAAAGERTYGHLAAAVGGPKLRLAAEALLLAALLGTVVTYDCAIGDLLAAAFQAFYDPGPVGSRPYALFRAALLAAVNAAAVLPLSAHRSLERLRWTSLASFLLVVALAGLVALRLGDACLPGGGGGGTERCFAREPAGSVVLVAGSAHDVMVQPLPILLFAFSCHMYVLPLFSELARPTPRRRAKVLRRSLGAAAALNLAIGVGGYLLLLDRTRPNILLRTFPPSAAVIAAQAGTALSLTLILPLAASTARRNVNALVLGGEAHLSGPAHAAATAAVVLPCAAAAAAATDIAVVFSLLGSSLNPLVCYALPALMFCRAVEGRTAEKAAAVACAAAVSAASAYGFVAQVVQVLGRA